MLRYDVYFTHLFPRGLLESAFDIYICIFVQRVHDRAVRIMRLVRGSSIMKQTATDRCRDLPARVNFALSAALSDDNCSTGHRDVEAERKRGGKKSSISHNGVSGSIPSRMSAGRKSSGTRRISLVHADSGRFVVRAEKSAAGSRKSRFTRPPPTFVRVRPPSFCSADNEAQNRIGRMPAIAPRSMAISAVRSGRSVREAGRGRGRSLELSLPGQGFSSLSR